MYNNKLSLNSYFLKSLTQNLITETSSISSYKESLNDFVSALVDYTSTKSSVVLFSGTEAKTLTFEKIIFLHLQMKV